MVQRSGFYIANNELHRCDVTIDWELGFDKEAKHIYVMRVLEQLSRKLPKRTIAEVTSASNNDYTRMLSPIYLKANGVSMEDSYKSMNKDVISQQLGIPKSYVFTHYYCSYAVHMLPLIRLYDVFTDVFYNPTKPGSTQAEACALLKLLDATDNMHLLAKPCEFYLWADAHITYRR